jgi:D-glycero-alpha-D-manno-heptose-7-phosphate kinase
VQVSVRPGTGVVDLSAVDFGDRYRFGVEAPPGRHPLLEATIARGLAAGCDATISAQAFVPPGSGLGTSAAIVVALLGALAGNADDAEALATRAHLIETDDLGWQSGVQDQRGAAHGGALRLSMASYPTVVVERLELDDRTWSALTDRLVTVYLGHPHRSSEVHHEVIAALSGARTELRRLGPLRDAAVAAAAALERGDLEGYGDALTANTDAQAGLHPALVCDAARSVIETAQQHGALGWKVNGAGGDGGTITVLAAEGDQLRAALADRWHVLDCRPTRVGLTVEMVETA